MVVKSSNGADWMLELFASLGKDELIGRVFLGSACVHIEPQAAMKNFE
jgi:hypothetical protein